MGVKCTWWERTGRHYSSHRLECQKCGKVETFDDGLLEGESRGLSKLHWPASCSGCGHFFDFEQGPDYKGRSATQRHEYRCPATGELTTKLPAGALYDAEWYHDMRTGADGRSLMCVLPNGSHWFIDGRATNCGSLQDDVHRCWVRHGDPTKPETMHVDKDGVTCVTGAGSIAIRDFHGFLHHGVIG